MKLKNNQIKNILLLWWIIVTLVAIIIWDIKISLWNGYFISHRRIVKNLDKIISHTWEFFMSPDNSRKKYSQIIWNTKGKLKIQTYDFTNKYAKELFNALSDSGVDVQIMLENQKYQQYQNTFQNIKEYFENKDNIQIKSDEHLTTDYLHSKVNIFDSWYIIQTANLNHSSFEKNREHFRYGNNLGILESLNTIYDKDWNGERIKVSDIHPNLLVCNVNCRSVIEYYLASAKESITIQTQYITDDNIKDILRTKIWEWIETKLLLANTDDNVDIIKYYWPDKARYLADYYNHTKIILIDNDTLILGSMNLSEYSLDENREIGIIITDKNIINQFLEWFEQDWKTWKWIW